MTVYYNEIEPYCNAWLQNLMGAGEITVGTIDDRSILDVTPKDLAGYERVHLFAGIAGWDLALQLAGWPEDQEVWTLSCPCQPFSSAGRQEGTRDEKHLWPIAMELIRAAKPRIIFGEQVASSAVVGKQEEGIEKRETEKVPAQTSCSRIDPSCCREGEEKGNTLRFKVLPTRHSGQDKSWVLRSNWLALQPGSRQDMGQSLNRSHQPQGRLYLFKHQDSLSCGEQCNGRLGRECSDSTRLGDYEQETPEIKRIISKIGESLAEEFDWPWLSIVQSDLEREGYTFGSCVLPAAGLGAPHIRQRLWFVAHLPNTGFIRKAQPQDDGEDCLSRRGFDSANCDESVSGISRIQEKDKSSHQEGRQNEVGNGQRILEEDGGARKEASSQTSSTGELADSELSQRGLQTKRRLNDLNGNYSKWQETASRHGMDSQPSNPWQPLYWLPCRDGKYRPTGVVADNQSFGLEGARQCQEGKPNRETTRRGRSKCNSVNYSEPGPTQPIIQPLAHGVPQRVGRLRAYGNAIVPQVAATFIKAVMEILGD